MNPFRVLIFFFLVCVFFTLVILAVNNDTLGEPRSYTIDESADLGSVSYWREKISQTDAQGAYRIFLTANQNADHRLQHHQAHVFGQALYESLGKEGLSVCDDSFAFGCYHSLLGHAIQEHGLSIVRELDQWCLDNLGPKALICQHAMGHGILATLGYQLDDLKEAVEACKMVRTDVVRRDGCLGGVFMEFNFQVMLAQDGKQRTFDPIDPHYPCPVFSGEPRRACYYQQAQWWASSLGGQLHARYARIGELCSEVNDHVDRENCLLGAGLVAGTFVEWDIGGAISLCDQVGSEKHICRAGAALSFYADPLRRPGALQICDGLEPDELNYCRETAIKI